MNMQLFHAIRPSNARSANRTKCKTLMLLTAMTVLATLPISVGLSAQQSPGDPRHEDEFTQIDVPGASFTLAFGINPRGDIVGLCGDSSFNNHGFLLSKGKFTTIDVPAATGTIPFGINPQGEIVGRYFDSNGKGHGFLLSNGTFTTIDVPRATYTIAFGINPRGDIVGEYGDRRGNLGLH
jgi:uncharacterized membrane protein